MKKIFLTLSIIFFLSPLSALALSFDGTNDYVSATSTNQSLNILGAVTIAAWVRPTSFPDGFETIFNKGQSHTADGIGNTSPYDLVTRTGKVRFDIVNTSFTHSTQDSPSALDLNKWSHVVGTWNGTTGANNQVIYVNGVATTSATQVLVSSLSSTATDATIGYDIIRNDQRMAWNGQIGEVRVYKRALTPNEIRMLYRGFPSRSGLVGYWPLIGNTSGTFEPDFSGYGGHGTRTSGPIRAALHPFTRLMRFR
jgi:hypothetical protein